MIKLILLLLILFFFLTSCLPHYTDEANFLCEDQDAICVDDSKTLKIFQKQLNALFQDGKTVSMKVLMKQLRRKSYALKLKEPNVAKLSPAEIYQQNKKGVLIIGALTDCKRCSQKHISSSSGFVLTKDGIAITNYHVVNKASLITLGAMTSDQKVFAIKEVLAGDKAEDIAIIRLEGTGFRPITLGREDPIGSSVTVISHPDRRFFSLTQGVISRYYQDKNYGQKNSRMAITADFARGSSGAPVFNEHGDVTGMVSSTYSLYYAKKNKQNQNLQMVIKQCVRVKSIRQILKSP